MALVRTDEHGTRPVADDSAREAMLSDSDVGQRAAKQARGEFGLS